MTTLSLREAGLADLEHAALLFDGYRQFYQFPSDIEACRAFLRERISHGDSRVFLVNHGSRPVGFMQLYPSFSSLSLRRVWILYDLFVAPESRKLGVARMLLEQARALALSSGASEVSLATAVDNRAAQHAYERMGWVRDDGFYYYNLVI
jgi:GNAT superfamily N-acetyltransferase